LAERVLTQLSTDYGKIFKNGLRTSYVVSITAVGYTWTADFWADFEQRIIGINKRVAKWL